MDNSNVRIVRLKSGEDILCNLLINDDKVLVNLMEPMVIEYETFGDTQHLMIANWLPVSLVKENKSVIPVTEVLCVMHPTDELIKYYNQTIEKMNSALVVKPMEELNEEEMTQMMEVMEEIKTTKGLIMH
jgi:hypothetical protein